MASIPGGHMDTQWGLCCMNNLLSKHCIIPPNETDKWTLITQASSIGSYGNDPSVRCSKYIVHFSQLLVQNI